MTKEEARKHKTLLTEAMERLNRSRFSLPDGDRIRMMYEHALAVCAQIAGEVARRVGVESIHDV